MSRLAVFAVVLGLLAAAAPAVAQPVQVSALAAPDAFTTPGRDTGLPQTLWRGASADSARAVLPLLAVKPLSPAARALARRVLATGAPGPAGAGTDPALTAGRASALMAAGDPKAVAAILAQAPGLDRSAELSRAAAESALISGDDARACRIADALSAGRDDIYWLRLRAYCQAVAGQTAQAQLTFDLAQSQAKDPVFARLMGAKLAGSGAPGAPALRNGLDYALSRNLGLDLSTATPSPAVAAALKEGDPAPPVWDLATAAPDLAQAAQALAGAPGPADQAAFDKLLADNAAGPKPRLQAAAVLMAALSGPLAPQPRSQIAAFIGGDSKAPAGRLLALDMAGDQKLMGEAALLALWTCAGAGKAGLALGDRVRIVRALHAVGLDADARAFALEGLLGLK